MLNLKKTSEKNHWFIFQFNLVFHFSQESCRMYAENEIRNEKKQIYLQCDTFIKPQSRGHTIQPS